LVEKGKDFSHLLQFTQFYCFGTRMRIHVKHHGNMVGGLVLEDNPFSPDSHRIENGYTTADEGCMIHLPV
jgi:hypothetical protein